MQNFTENAILYTFFLLDLIIPWIEINEKIQPNKTPVIGF